MQPSITIRDLGKAYTLTNAQPYIALRDVISSSVKNIFKGSKEKKETIWALKDVSLDIMQGERVGIIGRNGAGKSTLLKIISRITPPTKGDVWIQGRVGSLLEVGTGFHPELTGRENIYLNGSILGLKRTEITRQLDAIVDFSGIDKFIDSPLKHYSSGMQMRLAFSVAAHLESEILLIDEVLAVGDAEFQRKCMAKMEEVSTQQGRTVLFVSHDLGAVSRLTSRSIVLDKGQVAFSGPTPESIGAYHAISKLAVNDFSQPYAENKPSIISVKINTSEANNVHIHGKELALEFEINIPREKKGLALAFQVLNYQLQPVIHNWVVESSDRVPFGQGRFHITCRMPQLRLYQGLYSLNVYLGDNKGKELLDFVQNTAHFEITMGGIDPGHSYGWQDNSCVYREEHFWKVEKK